MRRNYFKQPKESIIEKKIRLAKIQLYITIENRIKSTFNRIRLDEEFINIFINDEVGRIYFYESSFGEETEVQLEPYVLKLIPTNEIRNIIEDLILKHEDKIFKYNCTSAYIAVGRNEKKYEPLIINMVDLI